MEVILLERVEKLGAIGDVVKVKDGFARNYLLPRKKALRANEANRKVFEANRARIEEDNASRRSDAEKAAKGVDGKTVQLIRDHRPALGFGLRTRYRRGTRGRRRAGGQEPGRARSSNQGDRRARHQNRASPRSVGDREGQRRPLAGGSRSAGAGHRRPPADVRGRGRAAGRRGARSCRRHGGDCRHCCRGRSPGTRRRASLTFPVCTNPKAAGRKIGGLFASAALLGDTQRDEAWKSNAISESD